MLVLRPVEDTFPDDADASVRYRRPTGLQPLAGPDGTPQAVLTRSPDGGLLSLRLGAAWPDLAPGDRPLPFVSGRFRLIVRTPSAPDAGRWRPTPVAGRAVVDRSMSLDPVEAAIARHLGREQNHDLVDVEVELTVRGLAPVFPWLASVDLASLRSRIAALLGETPAEWPAVEAAFLGLAGDTFTWHPLESGALRPPMDEALLTIAHRAAPVVLSAGDGGWTLADGGPSRLDISLATPRTETRAIGLRWSFSAFLAAQSDPGRHLIDVAMPAPFVAAELGVVNDIPLAAAGVRSIAVEVRTGGPSGMVRHEFQAGEASAARIRFVRETAEEPRLRWHGRAVVQTAGGPAVVESDERPCGLLIEVNSASLGLTPLRLLATPDVFEHVVSIGVTVGTRTFDLTADAPEAWAVGRQPPATAAVAVTLSSGEPHSLGTLPIGPMGLTVDAGVLGIGERALVVLRPPADVEQRAAYLGVQVEGHPWRTIDPGAELPLRIPRETRMHAPRLRYRTRAVTRAADGATSVMTESPWREAAGEIVTVEL